MIMRLDTGNLICFFCTLTAVAATQVIDKNKEKVSYVEAGSIIDYQPVTRHRGFFENDLRIYCYVGASKTLAHLLESVELQLEIEGDDYTQYEGATPAEVREHYDEKQSLFSFSLFSQKRTRLQLSPFSQQCIGIETLQPYRVRLQLLRVDFWRVIQLVVGVVLFIYAGHLSHNSIFYYITGVALGICSSFMLLIWLSSKLVPRKTMMYGVLIGGWTIGIYVIQMLWENLQVIVLTYRTYVFWYILITGLVSFFFCYRLGPPKNQRSKNIIKWLLQLMALGLIYFSSHFEEATAAIILITMMLHYFPRSLLYKTKALLLRRFPPKRRLLTDDEYFEQGVRETTKALEELRTYASSPECKQWKVMSKLRNPLRFAAFVEGASHLRDEEILRFEYSKHDDDESDLSLDEDGQKVEEEHRNGDVNQMRHSAQRQPQMRQQLYNSRPVVTRDDEMSEDEDYDGEDVVEVATTSSNSVNNLRRTPILNKSRHHQVTSPSSAYPANRDSPVRQRSLPRSARLVAAARGSISSTARRASTTHRSRETQEYSGESADGY